MTGSRRAHVPQERIDRRVRRTRELLSNALTSLILEEGYERVTVQDICDRADVGRSTFYAHFQDKEELLLSGFDDLQEDLRQAFADHEQQTAARQPGSGSWAALAVIEHLADYRAVSSMLGRRGSAVAIARLRRILSELLRDHLQVQLDPTTSTRVPMEVAVEVAVASLLGLIDWWLDHDRPYPPQQLEEMYRRLTEPGIRAALRPA
jgi:AcrR family transcriptional regulator